MPIPSWPQIGGIRKYLHFVTMTPWRNGSASDSRSEGCVFKSRRGQNFLKSLYHSKVEKKRTEKNSENTFVSCMRNPKMWNASRFCVSSLRRGHANLLCIVPILVYVFCMEYNINRHLYFIYTEVLELFFLQILVSKNLFSVK